MVDRIRRDSLGKLDIASWAARVVTNIADCLAAQGNPQGPMDTGKLMGLDQSFNPPLEKASKAQPKSSLTKKRPALSILEGSSRSLSPGDDSLPVDVLQESLASLEVSTPKAAGLNQEVKGNASQRNEGLQREKRETWSWKQAARRRVELASSSQRGR